MPLSEYPFAPRYAWVEDTYGVSWQLIMRECEPAESGTLTVLPALMFCGAAQNRCAAATDHYISTFPDSRVITRVTYPRAAGPATTDSVMFSELELAGQRITAMDSGAYQALMQMGKIDIDQLRAGN